MRTQRTELSRGVHNRKRRFRRSFNRLHNKRKHIRVYHRMSADRNLSNSAQSSDIINLIDDDDDNIVSHSSGGRLHGVSEDVQKVLQEGERGQQYKFGRRCDDKVKEPLATSFVDLSNDQEQAVCARQATRMRKRKLKSTILRNEEIFECMKLKVNIPQTVSDAGDEIKILGLDTGVIPLPQANANGLVPQQNNVFLVSQNSCSLKTEQAVPTCSSECIPDESTNPESTMCVPEEQRANESVIIVDSDDDSPVVAHSKSGRNYIPLVQKQFNASVEIVEHISKVPQSPELLVVKHIAPPSNMSTRQTIEDVVMFEDRTGSFEQFYNADFSKKLKKQNVRRFKTQNAGQVVDVQQLPEPVKKRDDSNIYNPTPIFEKGGLRPIIIDGNNVAWGHGNHKNFSAPGLEICINYFVQRKHRVIAFVPQHRKTRKVPGLIDMLDKYQKLGQIVMTPSRKIDGKTVSSYDDRYIVQAATELGGVIVSTDNYRDLMAENQRWKDTIEKRLLMFTWVGDMLMFPQDPLGRDGPTLEEFLRFPE